MPYDSEIIAGHFKAICESEPVDYNILNSEMHRYVSKIMDEMSITSKLTGRNYIIECIMYNVKNRPKKINLKGTMYRKIAEKYNTSVQNVERAMRTAIESGWKKAKITAKRKYTGELAESERKPTNTDFIISVSECVYDEFCDVLDKY